MLGALINKINGFISSFPFDYLLYFLWGSYAVIFLLTLVSSVFSQRIRLANKRPFLCLTNAYAGVNLALFLIKYKLENAIIMTVLFWVCGYLLYGLLCFFSRKKPEKVYREPVQLTPIPVPAPTPAPAPRVRPDIPSAKNNVRLEHALSVTDKLLSKNLGKGDRQELEKLKNTFAVLQIKGTLSPVESDLLNENFNTLLKLMAKYNV